MVIIIFAIVTGQSVAYYISGLGALTAVLLLVFQDTILSFVASVQIGQNDIIKIGDWIEVPEFGADGDVVDIALHTVKVQNWDKTITTIPTSKIVNTSVKNWRAMSEYGGRRIKRSLLIDISSIKFLTPKEISELEKLAPLIIDCKLRLFLQECIYTQQATISPKDRFQKRIPLKEKYFYNLVER